MNEESLAYIRENFSYDPITGVISKSNGKDGCVFLSGGYLRLAFHILGVQKKPMAHRAAWFLHFGKWPPMDIDHADGDKLNNKISNLRLATSQENMRNTACRSDSQSQIKGVRRVPSGRYLARISVDKREFYLGTFDCADEARRAFVEAAINVHGPFLHHSLAEPCSRFHGGGAE